METWKKLLIQAFKETGDDYNKMQTTLTEQELLEEFDDGYGVVFGKPFTAWGDKFVYFPTVHDGAEAVGYAPRNVCDIITPHCGGF